MTTVARSSNRPQGRQMVAQNKKARHDYSIEDVYEAGIALMGTEVKSLRLGRASLVDSFVQIHQNEAFMYGAHIPEYTFGTWTNHEPRRVRKLLLHREEILRMDKAVSQDGLTLVPLAIYFLDGRAKVELALARGRKAYDKRSVMATRDAARDVAREMGRRAKGH